MLEKCRNAQERWGGVHQIIDRWLGDRHQLLHAYSSLIDKEGTADTSDKSLQAFCQQLLDYTSAGHFEVYEQLTNEAREFNNTKALDLAGQIYPRIETLTSAALTFNDRCDNGDYRDTANLHSALAQLGHLLQERFELEDCLIEVLHNAHQQQAMSGESSSSVS